MQLIDSINLFLDQPAIAVIGVSRDKNKFGNLVYKTLKKQGKNVIAVNPHLTFFEGDKCYSDIETIPSNIKAAFINTPPEITMQIVKKASHLHFEHIWLQQGSTNDEINSFVKDKNMNVIADRCIMMFAEPVGSFHKIHRFFSKLTGNFPK